MEILSCREVHHKKICDIYNHYIAETVVTFETEELSVEDCGKRIEANMVSHPWLVCLVAGAVVGYAYAAKWRERSAYDNSVEISVYVDATKIGRGYGKALYRVLLAQLAQNGCHTVLAGIALPNEVSVKMHENFGFRKVAHFEAVGRKHGQWLDVGYWQKILARE